MTRRLRSLTINRFRDVRQGTTIEFAPRLNVLVGRNATGKTTLLNLISALSSIDVQAFAGETFSIEPRFEADVEDRPTVASDPSALAVADFLRLTRHHDAGSTRGVDNPLAWVQTASGRWLSFAQLSLGERRLFAFLRRLRSEASTIAVDFGDDLHSSWIESCVALLEDSGKQVVLASQNRSLLDCMPIDRALVSCEFGEVGELVWRNLGEAAATEIGRAKRSWWGRSCRSR